MRKFSAALCGLIIVCAQLWMPTSALAAAGDVASSYDSGRQCGASFVAFTTTGTTAVLNCGVTTPANHTISLVVTGSPTSCTASLLGDIGAGNYADLSGSQSCLTTVTFHVGSRPVDNIKITISALGGGSSPTVTAYYRGK